MSLKRNKRLLSFLILTIGLLGCRSESYRSEAMDQFLESEPKGVSALWFYPSTVRMASKILGSEYQNSLNPIKEGRVIFTWDVAVENDEFDFKKLQESIQDEGFEPLITMNSSGTSVQVFVKEGGTPTYIMFFKDDGSKFVVEAVGELTGDGLKKLSSINIEEAMDLFEIKPPEQKGVEDSKEES